MIIETKRLILRPWKESDAQSLYEYAKNPNIGPAAGWPVHTDVENSREIIRNVLSAKETYAVTVKNVLSDKETYAVTVKNVLSDKETCAVTVKNDDTAIGSVGLLIGSASNLSINDNEAEIGYWIAEPFWGRGYIPEAVRELIRYAFEELNISKLWCGYFDGNVKSKRVNEKCGFKFHHTEFDREWSLINAVKTQHITCFCKEDWNQNLSKRTAK